MVIETDILDTIKSKLSLEHSTMKKAKLAQE